MQDGEIKLVQEICPHYSVAHADGLATQINLRLPGRRLCLRCGLAETGSENGFQVLTKDSFKIPSLADLERKRQEIEKDLKSKRFIEVGPAGETSNIVRGEN